MTIHKGASWGTLQTTPHDLVTTPDEASAARAVHNGAKFVMLNSGDLLRALGRHSTSPPTEPKNQFLVLPCDVFRVTLNDAVEVTAVSSVVVGSWLFPQWWVTSGGFLGPLNVAPRAHPNDGLADALTFGQRCSLRTLLAIRRRMHLGTHLPHPLLSMTRSREVTWSGSRGSTVVIDGERHLRISSVRITVQPDAFSLCVPQ